MKPKTRNLIITVLFVAAFLYAIANHVYNKFYDRAFNAGVKQCESIWAVNNKGFKSIRKGK